MFRLLLRSSSAAPHAIVMVSSGAVAAGFTDQYRTGGGAAQLFSHSGADIEQLSKRLSDEQMLGVAIAQVTPSPYKISSKLTKEFGDIVAKTERLEVPVSYAMMEGYIAAKVIVEAVRRRLLSIDACATSLHLLITLRRYAIGRCPLIQLFHVAGELNSSVKISHNCTRRPTP